MTEINEKDWKDTTVLLKGDIHHRIINKQAEIYNRTKEKISIQDLVCDSVSIGIDKIDIEKYNKKTSK